MAGRSRLYAVHVQRKRSQRHAGKGDRDLRRDYPPRHQREVDRPITHPEKSSDGPFYRKLHEAGFVALRFGVDAFSENTLRLQKKGYTVDMVRQNLKECWEAGIFTEVNWVIGVPGETDADCEEGVDLILENQKYIGRLANINPLILVNGSVYWIDPERHGIRFRTSKEELYANNPRYVPADAWYSIDPYIDAQVRKQRFENIVSACTIPASRSAPGRSGLSPTSKRRVIAPAPAVRASLLISSPPPRSRRCSRPRQPIRSGNTRNAITRSRSRSERSISKIPKPPAWRA